MSLPNKKFLLLCTLFIVLHFGGFFAAPKYVQAASFYVNPATGQISSDKFSITITIDPEGDEIGSASAYLSYNTSQVEVSVINNGTFNAYTSKFNDPTTGIIYIEAQNTEALNGIVNFAVIEFTNLKKSQTIDLELLTTPTYKSTILDMEGLNIMTTAKSSSLTNLLNTSGTTSLTKSATPSGTIPETGVDFIDFRFLIILSSVLSFTSIFMRNHAKSKH